MNYADCLSSSPSIAPSPAFFDRAQVSLRAAASRRVDNNLYTVFYRRNATKQDSKLFAMIKLVDFCLFGWLVSWGFFFFFVFVIIVVLFCSFLLCFVFLQTNKKSRNNFQESVDNDFYSGQKKKTKVGMNVICDRHYRPPSLFWWNSSNCSCEWARDAHSLRA